MKTITFCLLALLMSGTITAQRSLDSLLAMTITPPYLKQIQEIGRINGGSSGALTIDVLRISPIGSQNSPQRFVRLTSIDIDKGDYTLLLSATEAGELIEFLRLVQPHSADRVQVYTEYYDNIGPGLQVRFFSTGGGKWWASIDTDTLFDRGVTIISSDKIMDIYRLVSTAKGLID